MPSASSSPQRTPRLRELPGDIDDLDAELGALVGRRLLRVGPAASSEREFTLLGHHRALDASRVYLELSASSVCGVPSVMPLPFPQRDWGWRLYEVLAGAAGRSATAPGSAPAPMDAEESARRRRDDMLRRVFS